VHQCVAHDVVGALVYVDHVVVVLGSNRVFDVAAPTMRDLAKPPSHGGLRIVCCCSPRRSWSKCWDLLDHLSWTIARHTRLVVDRFWRGA